ncbi:MAG: putative dsRNA-binding protein [bacterium]
MYLIAGYDETEKFIKGLYSGEFKSISRRRDFGDYKSEFQMVMLARENILPEYRIIKTEGEEHKKMFYVEVVWKDKVIGAGKGKTIKEAEQEAAKKALKKIKI